MGNSRDLFNHYREKEQEQSNTKTMKSLFEITTDQKALINQIELMEGEITPEMEEQLIITEKELQVKSIAYLEVIRKKESFNDMVDAEIKRLQKLKKVNGNLVDRLKENLLTAVTTFGNFTVGTHKFGTRKSSQVIVEDVNSLPQEFKTIKVTEAADKTALKKAIQAGQEIEGVYIQDNLNLKID